jgi:calcineurin-like phosphoesterase family protein
MSNVFLISDMHFGHQSIIKYENRPFKSIVEMDETIISNWNKTISKDDKVFVLGDVSFYNKEKTKAIIEQLNGYKTLIIGNHDKDRSLSWWRETGFNEVYPYPIIFNDFYIFSHEPVYLNENMPYANIHGHIHHIRYADKQFFNVSVECIDYTPIRFENIKETILCSDTEQSNC